MKNNLEFVIINIGSDARMDALMLIILLIIIIICIIIGIYISLYNKLQDYVIRINEVESKIDANLRSKYDHINRCVSIIKSNEDINRELDKKMFEEIVKLRNRKISNFDLYRKLIDANNQFLTLKNKYNMLNEDEDIKNLTKKIEDIDEGLEVNVDYYDRNISEYNKLIKIFPTNIVASICKYKEKLFFDRKNMNDDDFEDFKL